ncbi:uncharacterized protein METZ01_LOCUS368583 [marine metagenome]|uniref:Uncharacterized protein n=1 Tax=marine metagenome TaxID=408172 RepID=A0A382T0N3_9ZZZZ
MVEDKLRTSNYLGFFLQADGHSQ